MEFIQGDRKFLRSVSITLCYGKLIDFCEPSVKQNVLFYGSNGAVSNIANGDTKTNG